MAFGVQGRVIAEAVVNVRAQTDDFRRGLSLMKSDVGSAFSKMSSSTSGFRSAIGNVTGQIGALGSVVTGVVGGLGLVNAGQDAVRFGMDYRKSLDNAKAAIGSLVPEQEKATALLKDMTQFAINTPFSLPGVQTAVQQLLAVGDGFGVTSDNVLDFTEKLGNVVSVTGGTEDTMTRIVRVFGQMSSSGKVLGQDMNQLAQNIPGFDVWGALAEGTGKSKEELRKLQDEGKLDELLTGNEAVGMLMAGLEKMNGVAEDAEGLTAMERKMKTLSGTIEVFKDSMGVALADALQPFFEVLQKLLMNPAIQEGLTTLATAFGEVLGEAIKSLEPVLPELVDAFVEIVRALKPAMPLIAVLVKMFALILVALTPLIIKVAEFTGVVAEWLGSLDPAILTAIGAAIAAFWLVAFGPLSAITVAIVAFAALIATNWDNIKKWTQSLVDGIVAAWDWLFENLIGPTIEFIQQLIDPFVDLYNTLVGNSIIPDMVDAIIAVFQFLFDTAVAIFNAIKNFIIGLWNAVWTGIKVVFDVIKAGVQLYFDTYKAIIMAVLDAVKLVVSTVWNGIKTTIDTVIGTIKTIVQTGFNLIKSYIINPITEAKNWVRDRINDIWTFASNLPGRMVGIFTGMWDGIKTAFKGAVNFVIRGWNSLKFKAPSVDTPFGTLGGWEIRLPHINELATGGVLGKPTMFLGGEYAGARSNPEIVSPQSIMYDTMVRALRDSRGLDGGAMGWGGGALVTMPGAIIQDATDADLVAQRTLVAMQAAMIS